MAILLAIFAATAVRAAEKENLEYQVKAAFLLNFTRFVEWPGTDPADAPFSLCILGHDPFGRVLDRMVQGETVAGRKVMVRRVGREQLQSCQIVFADRLEKDVAKALAALGRGVLSVGEGDDFLREGGVIAFVIENRRVRFDVNMTAAGTASLKISSKLLNVARSVER